MRNGFNTMLRIIVLTALIFSTVGVTIVNCTCPKVEVKQTSCSLCDKNSDQKTKSCYPDCCKHLVLKTEFQQPSSEFYPLLSIVICSFSVAPNLNTVSYFPSPLPQRDDSNTISPGSVEKCALLSTFLI